MMYAVGKATKLIVAFHTTTVYGMAMVVVGVEVIVQ